MRQKRIFNILVRDWIGGFITVLIVFIMGFILFSSDDMRRPKIPKKPSSAASNKT